MWMKDHVHHFTFNYFLKMFPPRGAVSTSFSDR